MCKGKPLCLNKNDLKWCKNAWKLPSPNFTNIFAITYGQQHSKCTKGHQFENFVPNGQDILAEDKGDGFFYNCFNRADEDPFKKSSQNQSKDEVDKSWSDWVATSCEIMYHRRCLGRKPSQCVWTYCGYI